MKFVLEEKFIIFYNVVIGGGINNNYCYSVIFL